MSEQLIFISLLLITFIIFLYTAYRRILPIFKLKNREQFGDYPTRFKKLLVVVFLQHGIFRKPLIGGIHALVFWGFLSITFGSIEMVVDGVSGKAHSFYDLGSIYIIIMAIADVFLYIISLSVIIFLVRRLFLNIKRFSGLEITTAKKVDANISLLFILLLTTSLIAHNYAYVGADNVEFDNIYPLTKLIFGHSAFENSLLLKSSWWVHMVLLMIFANYLPYSKHFHVYLSIPNVFFSNIEPLGKLPNMDNITNEVKLMMELPTDDIGNEQEEERFGTKDVDDISQINYLNSLTCTQCGRCTSVCPANTTGKKLSPRKIFTDIRKRLHDLNYQPNKATKDSKNLLGDYISIEELFACTSCMACAKECPLEIAHPNLIIDMRRYIILEEPERFTGLNSMFANIENNGSPWQFSQEDRLNWISKE